MASKCPGRLLEMAQERGQAWRGPDGRMTMNSTRPCTAVPRASCSALLEGYQHFGEDQYAQAAVPARPDPPRPLACNWEVRAGVPARVPITSSHGTLGIVYALAATGHAAGRADLIDLALAGAADVVSRNEAGPDGFLVPHSDPQHKPERIGRYSYGWCHGPAGDAQAFRLLAQVTGTRLDRTGRRRWRTVTGSACPAAAARILGQQRPLLRHGRGPGPGLRPAYRARGRAGVRERPGQRPRHPGYGKRRRRALERLRVPGQPGTLAPRTGWAMGNAGIIRELLRYARIQEGRDPGYAIAWPDHPAAMPSLSRFLSPALAPPGYRPCPAGLDRYRTAGQIPGSSYLVEVNGDVQKGGPSER